MYANVNSRSNAPPVTTAPYGSGGHASEHAQNRYGGGAPATEHAQFYQNIPHLMSDSPSGPSSLSRYLSHSLENLANLHPELEV